MVKDPVCGMDVDSSKTQFKTIYKGEIYYFCSRACKKAVTQSSLLLGTFEYF